MLVLRQNPIGGRPCKTNNLHFGTDREGNFGYVLGYTGKCPSCGRFDGDKIILSQATAEIVAHKFSYNISATQKLIETLKPKIPVKLRLARWLLGKKKHEAIIDEELEFD